MVPNRDEEEGDDGSGAAKVKVGPGRTARTKGKGCGDVNSSRGSIRGSKVARRDSIGA